MANICVKLRQRQKNKYRKLVSTDEPVYSDEDIQISSPIPYTPGAALEEGDWFCIEDASNREYKIDLLTSEYSTVDFDSLSKDEFGCVDFIFIQFNNSIYFQNVSKARLVSKRSIVLFGEKFKYMPDRCEIVINKIPDAIYFKDTDVLYFKRLESITSIFRGIDQLYKEATEEETTQFLSNDFILLKQGYNASKVKTQNRKRIALAKKTLENLDADSRDRIFTCI